MAVKYHRLKNEKNPLLIILSGPSGVGKDAVLSRMKESGYPLYYTVTATTRPRRPGEVDGVDYLFISQEKFAEMIRNGEFLEWANVYGNLYGVPKKPVKQALASSQDVIIKVDVQGATTIKNILPQAVFIFLAPPSVEELYQRLKERKTESTAELELRLRKARQEMESLSLFDYVVVNYRDKVDLAISQIQAIITAEKCRVNQRIINPEVM